MLGTEHFSQPRAFNTSLTFRTAGNETDTHSTPGKGLRSKYHQTDGMTALFLKKTP